MFPNLCFIFLLLYSGFCVFRELGVVLTTKSNGGAIMLAHTCNIAAQEAEALGSDVKIQSAQLTENLSQKRKGLGGISQ